MRVCGARRAWVRCVWAGGQCRWHASPMGVPLRWHDARWEPSVEGGCSASPRETEMETEMEMETLVATYVHEIHGLDGVG